MTCGSRAKGPGDTEPCPQPALSPKAPSRQPPRLSAHTRYFPLSNLTFWHLTLSQVWHLKHLEEKQPAEAPREIRRKVLIVSAGSEEVQGPCPIPAVPRSVGNDLEKAFSFIRGDGGTRGTTQNSFISPCSCSSTNIWAAAPNQSILQPQDSSTGTRQAQPSLAGRGRGVCDCPSQQRH